MPAQEPILIVDDEENLLEGMQRTVGRTFNITTATGGESGLELMRTKGPFAVVLTDMRMPGMDGIMFLEQAKRLSPNSVFMMLTGNSDQQTAVAAVNRGRVFRFLNKPCNREMLQQALDAAIQQFHLQEAEQVILEKNVCRLCAGSAPGAPNGATQADSVRPATGLDNQLGTCSLTKAGDRARTGSIQLGRAANDLLPLAQSPMPRKNAGFSSNLIL